MSETIAPSPGSSQGPSLRKVLAVIACFVFVIFAVMLMSSCRTAWERMLRLDCQSNLSQLGISCREFAATNNGRFPSTWVELNYVGENTNWAKLLHCPTAGHDIGKWTQVDLWTDYRLLPGRTTNNSADTILALEPLSNHGAAGANVLFVDGSTAWWPLSNLLGASDGIVTNSAIK